MCEKFDGGRRILVGALLSSRNTMDDEKIAEPQPQPQPQPQETQVKKRAPRKKKASATVPDPAAKILRVPSRTTSIKSTLWAYHVHQVYKELIPTHLLADAVIDAFNGFVERLAQYDDCLETYVPGKRSRYQQGLVYEKMGFRTYLEGDIPGFFKDEGEVWRRPELKEKHKRIVDDIKAAYKVLYDLVKADLVPALAKKEHEVRMKWWIPRLRKAINETERAMEYETSRYEQAIQRAQEVHEMRMRDYERILQDNIAELAKYLTSTSSCGYCRSVQGNCTCKMVEVATGLPVSNDS
jgi:hypothetical protein